MKINGVTQESAYSGGYIIVEREWRKEDTVELSIVMKPRIITANSRIDAVRGSIAVEFGPFVYCLEEADNCGINLLDVRIEPDVQIESNWRDDLLSGIKVLNLPGKVFEEDVGELPLYMAVSDNIYQLKDVKLTGIPYYAWANRGTGQMRVWIPVV